MADSVDARFLVVALFDVTVDGCLTLDRGQDYLVIIIIKYLYCSPQHCERKIVFRCIIVAGT